MMQPKVGQGVCGRLRAGEEYSVQTPWPVWPSVLLVSMKNVAPVTWLLFLKFKRRNNKGRGARPVASRLDILPRLLL